MISKYQILFGNVPVKEAEKNLMQLLALAETVSRLMVYTASGNIRGEVNFVRNDRRDYEGARELLMRGPKTGIWDTIESAVEALTEKNSKNYSWILEMENMGGYPEEYAEKHKGRLNKHQISLLTSYQKH